MFEHSKPSTPKKPDNVSVKKEEKHGSEAQFELRSDLPDLELACTATADLALSVPYGGALLES